MQEGVEKLCKTTNVITKWLIAMNLRLIAYQICSVLTVKMEPVCRIVY